MKQSLIIIVAQLLKFFLMVCLPYKSVVKYYLDKYQQVGVLGKNELNYLNYQLI